MLWAVNIYFLLAALLLVQSVQAFLDGIRFLRLIRQGQVSPKSDYAPPAAVVIPCTGADDGFDFNARAFLNQDYPNYQVVFVVARADDAAYQRLRALLELAEEGSACSKPPTSLVVAGTSDCRGEKVNNLLHGIGAVSPGAEVLAFADIDATPSANWLRSLIAPLAKPQVTVSTGFRWYLPGRGFVSQLRAAWDTSIATMMGDHGHNFAWGGSMAIRTADFKSLKIAERYWAGTVSDDYALTRAVREAGGAIVFAPQCLVPSREESSLAAFLRWSTRQIIITRVYAGRLWRLGLAAYVFCCGTLLMGLVMMAWPGLKVDQRTAIAATLLAIVYLGMAKGYIRAVVARELFAEQGGNFSCYWQLAPLVPWIMLGNFVVAGFTRRIEWRGMEYKLESQDSVRVLRRPSE